MKKIKFLIVSIIFVVLLAGGLFPILAKAQSSCLLQCNQANVLKPCCKADANGNLLQGTCQDQGGFYLCVISAPAAPSANPANNPTAPSSPAAATTGAPIPIDFTNPLLPNTLDEFLTSVLGRLQAVIVILSLIFIIIGAIIYITSAGNETRMKTAKGAITAAMVGLAIGIAAPSFLREISDILGWTPNNPAITQAPSITQIAFKVLNFLLSIVGIIGLIMLIIGGIILTTSAGDEDRNKTGKKVVTYAIVGIVIALASMVIVKQIGNLLT